MKSRNKVAGVVVILVFVLVGGGIWWGVGVNAQGDLNRRYAQAVEVLTQDTVELATTTASLETMAGELFEADKMPETVTTALEGTEMVLSKVEESGHLSFADAADAGEDYVDVSNVPAQVLVSHLAEDEAPAVQSDDSQSGGSQASSEALIPLTRQLEELGYSLAGAQSGGSQSGDTAPSGATGVFGPLVVTHPADPDANYTKKQLSQVEELTSEVEAQTDNVLDAGVEVVGKAFGVKLDAALETYEADSKKLNDTIAKAEALLKSSEGKVADNKTRDALVKAIDAAKKEAKVEAPQNPVPSDLTTGAKSKATKALEEAMKAVTDSQAAKTKTDEEAAKAAQTEAQNSAPADGGYSEDYPNGGGYQAPAPAQPSGNGGGGGGSYDPWSDPNTMLDTGGCGWTVGEASGEVPC